MATPTHMPYVLRDLSELPHEALPLRGESEDQYFKRLVAEIRRHERAERRQRVIGWLLGRESAGSSPAERPEHVRSSRVRA